MLSILFVTFLDDSHNQVGATCMVDIDVSNINESEETLYDTIATSGVQVRKLMYLAFIWRV